MRSAPQTAHSRRTRMIRQTQLRYYAHKPLSATASARDLKHPGDRMLATLHATSWSKPLLPSHKRHLSLDGPLPRRSSPGRSAEAASEFEARNVQLQGLPGEAGSSSEEGPTKERRQARGFASTFTKTASAAELWQAAGSAGKDLRSSTLFSGGSARSPMLSAMEEGMEQE